MNSSIRVSCFITVFALLGAGCQSHHQHSTSWRSIDRAVCVINPTKGNRCRGVVRFTDVGDGVKIVADVSGLNRNQEHGFHIHQFGDASDPAGKSAGGHYDPKMTKHHSRPDDRTKHAGDLGNLEAGGDGVAHYERVVHGISVAGLMNPIIGRGVIVHAKPDDYGQPTGNAGARIGCGVIGIARGDQ